MTKQARKRTQRSRLLKGMVDTTVRRGYAGANISAVIAQAGVSRPTFYDYFADRDDCFRATIEDVQAELLSSVEQALESAAADDALPAAVAALVAHAAAQPVAARFLMGESMAGGAGALAARDEGVALIATAIERAGGEPSAGASRPDLDARVLVGGVYRVLATRLRRGEVSISPLAEELTDWVESYRRPVSSRAWSAPAPPSPPPSEPRTPIQSKPSVLPPGRPRIPEEQIAENHRLRILYATALLAAQKGYAASTVAGITRLASVDGRVFYRHFADKQEAFAAVHELGLRQLTDATAAAFFSEKEWPMRSWQAGLAFTRLLQANPLVAHVGFVEAPAVGPMTVQRIEDANAAFAFFLREGLADCPAERRPPQVALEAILAAIFEIVYLQARTPEPRISAALPHIAHLWLTPFIGAEQASELIEREVDLIDGWR
jgi:AcrR family transcriptional regulator